ncbi:MAG: DUF1579 domain-containing protein [Candidatus Sumerlaeia bacterium]|nr:DUF1579 domain-containing protein [Candidatus Sumerlaeia bacterium]
MQPPEPTTQHRWLAQLVGDWTSECLFQPEPGAPTQSVHGRETVRAIGGLWIVLEGRGQMPCSDLEAHTMMTLGYIPESGRFVGSWVGSMMTLHWVYDGELDEAAGTLTLSSEGPAFDAPGKRTRFRDVVRLLDPGHRTLTGLMLAQTGEWVELCTTHYRRV